MNLRPSQTSRTHTGTMLNVYVSLKCIKRFWLLEVILTGLLGMFWAIGKPFEPCPSAPGPSSSPLGSLLGRLPGITVRLGGLLHRLHALHDVPSFPVLSMTSQEGPQTAQDGAKTAQELPRGPPELPTYDFLTLFEGFQSPRVFGWSAPKTAQEAAQEAPKRRPQDGRR